MSQIQAGILPLAKSSFDDAKTWIGPGGLFGFNLPGHGEAYEDCGEILAQKTLGCLEVEKHNQSYLDSDKAGRVVIKVFERNCMRAECPQHYHSWASKQAGSIVHRISNYQSYLNGASAIHVTVSPRTLDWYMDYPKMKSKAQDIAKRAGFRGGCCIFHPFRQDKSSGAWFYSPHFHLIGFGWIKNTGELFSETGWVVKNLGARRDVKATAFYQLTHCGIHSDYHSVVWFGDLSYNKFKCPPKVVEVPKCPLCGGDLRPVEWVGEADFYDGVRSGIHYLKKSDNWIYTDRLRFFT